MSEIIGIEIPVGFKLLNPEPLNSWEGPYTSIEDALTSIPIDGRYPTMEIKILDPINGNKKYWFKDGIEDTDLVYFGSDLSIQLTGETASRIAADLELQNNINNLSINLTGETANRIAADSLLNNTLNSLSIDLSGETTNRIAANLELQNSIINIKLDLTGETASRIYNDTDLQNKINNLDSNISNNYNELSADLNNLTDTVSGNYTTLNDKIISEIGNRENSDINLNEQISGETASRIAANIIINTRIDNGELIDINNYIDLQNQITGESATRQIQDENLANEFTGLTEQVMQAHMTFSSEISGETASRIAADALLTNDLNDLTDLINQSHAVFNNEISGETVNRIAGDFNLQSQINNEVDIRISSDLLKADLTGATFSGNITAPNLSGNNSGDQDISNLIPFTGATKNVDLGDKSITVETLVLNPEPTIDGFKEGVIFYDKPNKTISAMIDHEITLQIGQEELALCFNNSGVDIPNGSIVYQTGAYGDMPTIALAKADSDTTSIIIGMATQIIYANDSGFITVRGIIHNINTIGFSSSAILYLSPFIAGGYTDIIPTDSSHFTVKIGTVLLHNNISGSVYVQQNNNVKLAELLDVSISNPKLDEIIRYNGINWVNGAPSTSSSSPGIEFFPDRAKIISGSSENFFSLETLNKYPVIRTETIDSINCVEANVPVLGGGYLYNTQLNRTVIDPGNWSFNFFLSASSISDGRESTVINNMYKVSQYNGLTITDSGTSTIRNVVASGDSPFSIDKIDLTGIITEDSFIQTPKGVYQILSRISDNEITILTPTGYTNETNVEFFVFKKLFASYSPIITTIGVNYGLYSIQSSQEAFTILETDKLAMLIFANNTTNDPTTINYIYNDQDYYSHISSPLSTLHNDLAGLQGGNLNEKYHLTLAQYSNVNNLSGINTGNQLPDNVTIIGSGSPVSPFTVPSLNGITSNVQTQINSKLDKNINITGATHTKVTYDSKGLIISAVDALTSDVNDSLDRRYVTDQEKVNINYLTGITSNVQTQINNEINNRVSQDTILTNLVTGETSNRIIADLLKADLTGATFSGNITAPNLSGNNSGDQTLLGLGGQPKITGTGFVKSIGDIISFDNSTYYLASNPNDYISGINNGMVINALGYTPYNSTNPNGYISSYIDTITRVSGTGGVYVSGDILIQGIGKITTSQSSNTITIASETYSASDVGLGNVTNNPQWYSGNHPTTLSGYGITDTPWLSYLGLTGGTMVSGANIFNPNDISNGAIGFYLDNNSFGSITFPTIFKSSINPNIVIGTNTYGIIHDGNLFTSVNSNFVVGANSTVLNTDSLNAALGKLQGQINNKQASGSYLTGTKVDSFNTRTGAITLSSSDVTTALTFTPYNSTNPNGYTNNTGTVTSITAGSGLSGGIITTTGTISLTSGIATAGTYKSVTVDTYGRITAGTNPTTLAGYGITDAVTGTPWTSMGYLTSISSAQVTGALGFTPYNSTNPNGYIAGINSSMVTTALGYTPYNSTNPSGYITGINSGMITSALGYTPYNSTNPNGYITSSGTASAIRQDFSGANAGDLLYSQMADNDQFRLRVGGTSTNAGYVEFATADDGSEPFYFRQYTGVFGSLVRTLTLLDESGNTSIPGTLNVSGVLNSVGQISSASSLNLISAPYTNIATIFGNWSGAGVWGFGNDSVTGGHTLRFDQVSGNSFVGATDIVLKLGIKTVIDSSSIGSQKVQNATCVDLLPNRTDGSAYPVLWGANQGTNGNTGNQTTYAFSCAAVSITSSIGQLNATNVMTTNAYYFGGGNNYWNWEGGKIHTNCNISVDGNINSLGYLQSGGDIYINQNFGRTLVGVYDASRLQGIYTMGDSWRLAADGTSSGNLYGLAWSHPNAGGQASNLSTHGLLVMQNGTTMAAISQNIWIQGTYYGNGAGLSNINAAWTNISGRPTNVSQFSNDSGYVTSSTNRWYDGWVNAPGYDANSISGSKSGFSYSNNAPWTGALVHFDAGGYGLQLSSSYVGGTGLSYRTRQGDAGSWNSWYTIFHSGNFTPNKETKLWAESHSNDYYLRNNWDGTYWQLTSNHGASVNVGHADNAGYANLTANVSINYNNDSNSTYQMLWGSGNSVYGTAGIYCNPATDVIYAYTFQLTSDIRSKQNISLVEYNPIEVDIKEYEFKNNPGKKHYGVIAQEIVINHPELVEEDPDGKLSVNYIDLIMLELSNLRKEIKNLKEKYERT